MNLHNGTLRLAFLACISIIGLTSCQAQKKTSTPSSTQQKIAALQGLRDSGVLSEDEYEQKVAALRGAAAPGTASASRSGTPSKIGTPTVAHTLEDRAWGLPWGTIKLPAGWGFNGSVVHGDNCMVSGDNPMWVAESPDKTVGLMLLPVLKASWTSDQRTLAQMQQAGCPILHSTRAADYLTQVILPHLHKDFKVVGVASEPMFDPMVKQLRQMNAQAPHMQSQYSRSENTVDAARVVITYPETGATRVEIASAELSCNVMMMAGFGRQPGSTFSDCTSFQTVIVHAPDDGTPIASLATMDLSKSAEKPFFVVEQNPNWQKRFEQASQQKLQQIQAQNNTITNSNQSMNNNNQTEFEKRQAIQRDLQNHTSNAINSVYNNRQAASAQVNGAYAAHMGDYNIYTNNSTGQQYQLSNQYNNTYVDQNGTVAFQTNSANSPGVDWSAMTPKY